MRFEELGTDGLRDLIEGTADGIMVVDAEGVVRYGNPSAREMFNRRDLEGTPFGIPLLEGDTTEIEVPAPGGGTRIFELRVARAHLDRSEVFLVSLHDLTERRQAEEDRERARAEAEAAARTRSALLNMVAHEFRTPLTVIGGYLSMIADGSLGPVPDAWQEVVEKVNEKSEELKVMIEEVLLAARLEAGRLESESERLDLRDVVRAAIKRATGRGQLLRAQIRIELPPEPLPAEADAAQVGIILDNLVNNALTYSMPAEPALDVCAERDGDRARITVTDRGIGIAPEQQAAIFERFRRVSDGGGRPGTGLGLAIAKDLARLNGGDLSLEWSRPGAGSRFLLELPVLRAE